MANYRAYKFRLYPSDEQKELIHKSFGCCRFVYNYYLARIKTGKYMSAYTCIKDYVDNLKDEYAFLAEADSIAVKKSLFNLENAYKTHFKGMSEYPKFKRKYNKNSYTTNAIYSNYKGNFYCNIELDLNNNKIKLPKLKWITIKGYRNKKEITGRIINVTISKEQNGKYYVSVLYNVANLINKPITPSSIVGLDLGIKKLITLSDGVQIDNNRYILKYEKKIKRLQHKLTKKISGSKNYFKAKKKLAILYSKLKNARNHYIHKITKMLTDNYDIIVGEKLQTAKMIQAKQRAKNIMDASFQEILRQLQYKTKLKNKYFYQIDTFYPSSQVCSSCDNIDKKYKNLRLREYICNKCYNEMDRDLNASINIMFEGLKLYMNNYLKI